MANYTKRTTAYSTGIPAEYSHVNKTRIIFKTAANSTEIPVEYSHINKIKIIIKNQLKTTLSAPYESP